MQPSVAHPFILVLHFPPEPRLTSADIEDDIAEAIGNPQDYEGADHIVDGNEVGDGIDIFVLTRDPVTAFELCKPFPASGTTLGYNDRRDAKSRR